MAICSRLRRLQERKKVYRRTGGTEPTPTPGGTHRKIQRYRGYRVPKRVHTGEVTVEEDGTHSVMLEVEIRGPDEPVEFDGLHEAIGQLEDEDTSKPEEPKQTRAKKGSKKKPTKLRKVEDD